MTEYSDLEYDLAKDSVVISYLKDVKIARQFYAALCDMQWEKINSTLPDDTRIVEKLQGINSDIWHCSWRHAGGIIADIRNANYNVKEDYVDFYCSGNEGVVTNLVKECLERIGWKPLPWDDNV